MVSICEGQFAANSITSRREVQSRIIQIKVNAYQTVAGYFPTINPLRRSFFCRQYWPIVFVASSNQSRSASKVINSMELKNFTAFGFGLPSARSFPALTRMATSSVVQFIVCRLEPPTAWLAHPWPPSFHRGLKQVVGYNSITQKHSLTTSRRIMFHRLRTGSPD